MDLDHRSAITDEHLVAIDELLALEARNVVSDLNDAERQRWRDLTDRLFGSRNDERRRFFRIQTQRSGELVLPSGPIDVRITSMSIGGLFLQTDQVNAAWLGQEWPLVLHLPMSRERQMHLKVRICWVAPRSADAPQGLGVRFVNLDNAQREQLLEHLRAHLLWLLEMSREKYHFFFQHSADIAMLLDPEDKIQEINDTGAAILGRGGVDMVGTSVYDLITETFHEDLKLALRKVGQQDTITLPLQLNTVEGLAIPVDANLIPFHVQDLQMGAMLVAQDQRQRRRIEEQQRSLERRLFQADKIATIGQITAGIAHDINNPLAYVLSNLALLHDYLPTLEKLVDAARTSDALTGEERDQLSTIAIDLPELVRDCLDGSRRIRDILREIRDFSRVDNEAEVSVDINNALDASIRVVKNLIKHRARLEREYGENLPVTYCNFGRLSQIFLNLLVNATQAFDETDIQRNVINVRTDMKDAKLLIRIMDNGRGIPDEIKGLIFEPFFTTRRKDGGTGLGLAIARENVEALGGTLVASSDIGKGTTFTILLPVHKVPELPHPKVQVPTEPRVGRKHRLLIVDDEPALLRGYERILQDSYEVTTTISPRRALRLIVGADYDLILCDVMNPEMSGLEFRKELMRVRPELAARMLFLTGGTFNVEEEYDLRQISNIILEKPIEPDELIGALEQALLRGKVV